MKEKLQLFLIPRAASVFMRLLHASLRVRHFGSRNLTSIAEAGGHYLMSFWHCHILLMVFCRHSTPIAVMISRHKDGEYIASTMRRFSVDAVRGSSSRGGAIALQELLHRAANGWNIAITPDGPRGPARVAQIGVVVAAQRTGLPIVPVAVISEKKKQLRSWDRFEIPYPLSRVVFAYGDPIHVPSESSEEDLESWRAKVETSMRELCDDAEARFSQLWSSADR